MNEGEERARNDKMLELRAQGHGGKEGSTPASNWGN